MPNPFNVPIETLYQALYWPTFNGDPALDDDELSNIDDDEFDKATAQGKTVYEIKDDWGSPLVYFVHTDYATAVRQPPVVPQLRGRGGDPAPWKYEDEARGFAEPRGVQLFSMGEDGIPTRRTTSSRGSSARPDLRSLGRCATGGGSRSSRS